MTSPGPGRGKEPSLRLRSEHMAAYDDATHRDEDDDTDTEEEEEAEKEESKKASKARRKSSRSISGRGDAKLPTGPSEPERKKTHGKVIHIRFQDDPWQFDLMRSKIYLSLLLENANLCQSNLSKEWVLMRVNVLRQPTEDTSLHVMIQRWWHETKVDFHEIRTSIEQFRSETAYSTHRMHAVAVTAIRPEHASVVSPPVPRRITRGEATEPSRPYMVDSYVPGRTMTLEWICTDQDRGGAGAKLMKSIKAEAKDQGCYFIIVHALDSARPWYLKHGFTFPNISRLSKGIPLLTPMSVKQARNKSFGPNDAEYPRSVHGAIWRAQTILRVDLSHLRWLEEKGDASAIREHEPLLVADMEDLHKWLHCIPIEERTREEQALLRHKTSDKKINPLLFLNGREELAELQVTLFRLVDEVSEMRRLWSSDRAKEEEEEKEGVLHRSAVSRFSKLIRLVFVDQLARFAGSPVAELHQEEVKEMKQTVDAISTSLDKHQKKKKKSSSLPPKWFKLFTKKFLPQMTMFLHTQSDYFLDMVSLQLGGSKVPGIRDRVAEDTLLIFEL